MSPPRLPLACVGWSDISGAPDGATPLRDHFSISHGVIIPVLSNDCKIPKRLQSEVPAKRMLHDVVYPLPPVLQRADLFRHVCELLFGPINFTATQDWA